MKGFGKSASAPEKRWQRKHWLLSNRRKLNLDPLPLYLSGAVLHKNSLVRESLIAAMLAARPILPVAPRMPALLGAAAMALADGGVAVTEEILETLEASYRDMSAKIIS